MSSPWLNLQLLWMIPTSLHLWMYLARLMYVISLLAESPNACPGFSCSFALQVWRIDNHDKVPVPAAEIGKFYSGDCYIVQYTFQRERKNEYLVFFWLGRNSTTVQSLLFFFGSHTCL